MSSEPVISRRAAFKTLGCKLNQAETESIATGFKALGWEIVEFGELSDVIIVNSCTVTNSADRKSRSAMNQALRTMQDRNPEHPLVVMTGCYVDGYREKLEADGRTYVVGNNLKSHIPQLVDAHFKGEILPGYSESERAPFGYPLAEQVFRTRAMIKIQDGCDNFCSYCIIPFVRGRAVSRPLSETVNAVEEASASGFKEIVLTGVNMSRWEEKQGEEKQGFSDLVEACLNAEGDFRLRLGSVEPDLIDTRLINLMAHPKMTAHMHLCLQSGSEKILLSMKRQYSVADFESIAGELRNKIPGFNLTTDVIVGFPGESDEDFADTLRICERLKFGHIHTFPYSRRDGTRAVGLKGHVSETVKKSRAQEIRKLSEITKRAYRSSQLGSVQEVLVETAEKVEKKPEGVIIARGFSASYVPVKFSIPGGLGNTNRSIKSVQNRIFRVRVNALESGNNPNLLGETDLSK